MPMPAAIRVAAGRVRRSEVSAPYGPSRSTLVPGRMSASDLLPSPRSFTVMRSIDRCGGADSE